MTTSITAFHLIFYLLGWIVSYGPVQGIDTAEAMVAYPDILARDYYTPGLGMSALQWQSADYSLLFEAYDDELYFGRRGDLGDALACYSGGLVVLG